MEQIELFGIVDAVYEEEGALSNPRLYREIEKRAGRTVFGIRNQAGVDLLKRKVRWYQQTLKHAGVLTRNSEGLWQKTGKGGLHRILSGFTLLGFSTRLGLAVVADCRDFFAKINEPVHLIVTSPPYPLARERHYGNVGEQEYVDWLCTVIEPVVKLMADGASLCLNIGNDIFLSGSPARSLYRERLVLALSDRLGLYKMDELVWHNPNKPPTPVQWASLRRIQLNAAWEPVYWFTNNPHKVFSDNRRVLQPHSEQHLKFVQAGGVKERRVSSDGSHVKVKGAYAKETEGRIPRNVLRYPHDANRSLRQAVKEAGLPQHGATMPLALAEFLVRFLSRENDLVADPFSGSFTTAKAAENNGRRWIGTERVYEYVAGASLRFQ